jgi:hypothetical protein
VQHLRRIAASGDTCRQPPGPTWWTTRRTARAHPSPTRAPPFRRAEPDPLWQRAIPVAKELEGYRIATARRELLAGVTFAALAIPSAMAYAELAGLPAVPVCTRSCCRRWRTRSWAHRGR